MEKIFALEKVLLGEIGLPVIGTLFMWFMWVNSDKHPKKFRSFLFWGASIFSAGIVAYLIYFFYILNFVVRG